MAEYIEREAFREVLRKSHEAHANNCREEVLLDRDIRLLNEQPAADVVEVVRGCWVGTADGYADGELVYDMWECSECGYDADGADEKPNWNFCPNCGADMRERRTDDGNKENL